ncbi:MAG TPA: EamA family transporter [Rhabdochlamydiaceae bacterium]|jgi:O-acetylserine/cysteine efflux transporter
MQTFHIICALLVVVIWGFNFVVIKIGLDEISPLLLGFARFFLTSITAIFFVKRPKAPFKMVIWYGLVMFALQFALLFMGMYAGVTPGLASLLLQLQMFFTVLLALLFFKEKLRLWQIIGALVSFAGIAIVAMHLSGNVTLLGFLLVIGSAASWGAGNVISKKIGKVNMVSLVIWGSLIAWPPLLAISLIVEGGDKIVHTFQHLTWLSGGAVLYITYLSTLLGFGIWSWLLHRYPLGTIAPFTLLVPVFGILSSALVLNEPLEIWKLGAAALVIIGLCINLVGPKMLSRK